jgi:hypothetical protein
LIVSPPSDGPSVLQIRRYIGPSEFPTTIGMDRIASDLWALEWRLFSKPVVPASHTKTDLETLEINCRKKFH